MKLNIFLHLIVILGLGYLVWEGGDSFFSGVMATLALAITIDMVDCIKNRQKETNDR